jgi:DNA-binding transcriptional LysR family regulator
VKIQMSELSSVEIIEAVRSDGVDIGIFSGLTDAPGLTVLPYRRDTLVLTTLKGHPLATRTSVSGRATHGGLACP